MREGEVNILGGLTGLTDSKTINGIPGLGQVPGLKWFFGSENKERIETELLIALVPHIIRSPEITPSNLRGVSAGSDQTIKLTYAPRKEEKPAEAPKPAAAPPARTQAPAQPAPAVPILPIAPPGAAQILLEQVKSPGFVTLTAQVRNTNDLFSAPMRVQFDPKVLKLVDVVRGNALSPQGEQINFTPVMDSAASGEARVEMSRLPGSGGVSNAGALVVFRFETVGKGTTMVAVTDLNLKNSQNQPIPASAMPATIVVE
jgi:general secretion pathway protein D